MTIVSAGSSIKSLGGGRYGGFGVPFGGEPDCVLDVFDPSMGLPELGLDDGRTKIRMLWAHGGDKKIGKRRIAWAEFELQKEGLWIEWQFENPSDPVIANMRILCDEGSMALSSASYDGEREPRKDYRLIKKWFISEISLTGSACAVAGRTRVSTLKEFDGFTLEELMRRRGLTESQILREESEELRYRCRKVLGELTKCDEEWLARQRGKRVEPPDRRKLIAEITMETAKKRLEDADALYKEIEGLEKEITRERAEITQERARLHLGPGIPYRHFEDWILAGEKSGFIRTRSGWAR